MIRAMAYQAAFYNLGLANYALVGDRCPLNNFVWRFIMMLLGSEPETLQSLAVPLVNHWLDSLPQAWWDSCRAIPTIVLVDYDADRVVERMKTRAQGADLKRAEIKWYVQAQNLVYTAVAVRCGYPIFTWDHDRSLVQSLLVEKIQRSVRLLGPPVAHVDQANDPWTAPAIDEAEWLAGAADLKILK